MVEISRNERVLGPVKVGLRRDLHFTRQQTRGGPRYIAHDPVTFQNHAFSAADYQVLTAIIRGRTLSGTLDLLIDQGHLDNTEADHEGFYRFVLWLHGTGLLHLPLANGDVVYERHLRKKSEKRSHWYHAFLNYKIPLGNPDALLRRTLPAFGWLFTWPGVLVWTLLMGTVAWKCLGRFDELLEQTTTILALANLPLLWIALVGLKAIHEFGHAYACRKYGAPVPEMGIVMIMMTPCAYVDASASWRLMRRRQRAVVAFGGMYIESIVAAIAALVWAGTAPGLLHDLAANVVILASVVTVLFNINPLMRYDGYYLFSDLVGVFNLQQRATRFLNSWVAHIVIGAPRPTLRYSTSEKWLYSIYGPATFVYRLFLATAISTMVLLQWPSAGVFLAAVFLYALLVRPAWGTLRGLWTTEIIGARTRARLVAIGTATLLPLGLSVLPVSWHVTAPGILDPNTRETVRAPTAGFVRQLHVKNGDVIVPGATLCTLHNPELEARRTRMQGELTAERISYDAIELEDPTQAAVHKSRINYLDKGVKQIERSLDEMAITSSIHGTVSSPRKLEVTGRFLQQGEELLQIQSQYRFLRVLLSDEDVSRARLEIGGPAEVRFACDPEQAVQATVYEIQAAASRQEIPLALTLFGGGDVYATPIGETGTMAVADQPYLHIILQVDSLPLDARGDGLTARVRFPARLELLGAWMQRRLLTFLNSWRMT